MIAIKNVKMNKKNLNSRDLLYSKDFRRQRIERLSDLRLVRKK
jgi:hypothetical protein